ncbi:unnamed protein product [Boreogadus saida]
MSSSLVNSLAKVYDPNPLHGQKLGLARKLSTAGSDRIRTASPTSSSSSSSASYSSPGPAMRCVESRMDSLNSQMEQLLHMQHTVLTRLDGLSHTLGDMGQDLASMRAPGAEGRGQGAQDSELLEVCLDVRGMVQETNRRMECQALKLEGVEKLVEGMQQVLSFIGEVVKKSRLVEVLFKQSGKRARKKAKDNKAKDEKEKAKLSPTALKALKKRGHIDPPPLSHSELQENVDRLNRQNAERTHGNAVAEGQQGGGGGGGGQTVGFTLSGPHTIEAQSEDEEKENSVEEEEEDVLEVSRESEVEVKLEEPIGQEQKRTNPDKATSESQEVLGVLLVVTSQTSETAVPPLESSEEPGEMAACSKRRVTEEDVVKEDLKKSCVVQREEEGSTDGDGDEDRVGPLSTASGPDEGKTDVEEDGAEGSEATVSEYTIDSSPPPSAPFDHRIVTPKPQQISTFYTINREEVLGGGRFGQVHKCMENSSGLTLAAKIIKARSQKEKDVVKNEIQVMNQLNHVNLIQLHAAYESRHDIILVMEYVDGGELFDRIIDENYNLTELDTVLFIRQICEGLQYMHKMYILHLDLKPENILCVSRVTNKIKIIDFGLARRYKPREKLRVNFGTPEFLAPEVINYEFVSFPTDLWSLGVITYMLLSGLSPFLGDDDNETLNNILACQWNFEEEEFLDVSEEAKDFITRLLVKSKSWRMSATASLKHPWLCDPGLHYRLQQKKLKCDSTTAPPPES